MKKKIGIIVIIFGIVIVIYPIISNIISSYNQSVAISNYKEQVTEMSEEQIQEEKDKAREYNKELSDTTDIDISNIGGETTGVSYLNVLNIGDVMGYVEIPKINVYLPIYHGVSEDVLQSGVGHLENSSFPIGEKGTHAIFAGHTGLVRAKIFDDLDKLVIGDKFYIHMFNEKYEYEVDQIKVVEPSNTDYTAIDPEQEYVTLLTCTPYAINSHRLLVRGTRIENDEETEKIIDEEINNEITDENNSENKRAFNVKNIIIILAIIWIIFVIFILSFKIKNSKKRKS